jgi:CBS domain-containing protein
MDMRKVAQIPVVTAGKVIGIVNRFELIAALERSLSEDEESDGRRGMSAA